MSTAIETSGNGYLWRRLSPMQSVAIADAHASGVTVRALAERYGVTRRTIYRTLERVRTGHPVVVQVEHWTAEFMVTSDGPIRMTAWHAKR